MGRVGERVDEPGTLVVVDRQQGASEARDVLGRGASAGRRSDPGSELGDPAFGEGPREDGPFPPGQAREGARGAGRDAGTVEGAAGLLPACEVLGELVDGHAQPSSAFRSTSSSPGLATRRTSGR